MSADRGGRRGGNNRTVTVCLGGFHRFLLWTTLLLDLSCVVALILFTENGKLSQITWRSVLDWKHAATDVAILVILRLLVVLVTVCPIQRMISMGNMGEEDEGSEHHVTEGAGYGRVATSDPDDDPFAGHRARSIIRRRNKKLKTAVLSLLFILFTLCNVFVAMKCLWFTFTKSPYQEALLASTVLWVNVELFSQDAMLDGVLGGSDSIRQGLHPHPLRFNHQVRATKCDVCNQRIIREDYECVTCDFDCCLSCFRNRTQSSGSVGVLSSSHANMQLSPLLYIWRSFRLLLPFWPIVAMSLSCLVINQVIRVSLPNFQGKVLDSIITGNRDDFWSHIRSYCLLSTATLFLGSARSLGSMLVGRHLTMGIRGQLFSKLIRHDVSYYDETTVGSLTARMTNDVQAMTQPVNTLMNSVLSNLITLLGAVTMCLLVSWRLAMISLAVVGPIMYVTGTYAKWSARINRGVWDALAKANSTATEAFVNIRTVRAFSTEEFESEKFSESMVEALSKTLRDAFAYSGAYLATNLMDLGASAILLGFGGFLVIVQPDQLSVGQLVTFQLYANMMNGAYQGLNGVLDQFTKSAGAAERVLAMLDRVPSIDITTGSTPASLMGRIEMRNVNFSYQLRPDRMVLRNVSIIFPENSVTAIVGRSGGGKSTIVHLLLRFYDPTGGMILVDGSDLRDLSLSWLHHQFAVVAQDTQLFNTTIQANIAYGLEIYDPADVRKASIEANAHDFIMGFPEGYNTQIGERGVRLSGGQRQRIAIARALLRRPRVLLLDEATSALDTESEALVQQALDKLIEDLHQSCTIIVIAHRLSTVVNANSIVVLDDGVVAEQGTHKQLLQSNGPYHRLVDRQLRSGGNTIDFSDDARPRSGSAPRGGGKGKGQHHQSTSSTPL